MSVLRERESGVCKSKGEGNRETIHQLVLKGREKKHQLMNGFYFVTPSVMMIGLKRMREDWKRKYFSSSLPGMISHFSHLEERNFHLAKVRREKKERGEVTVEKSKHTFRS